MRPELHRIALATHLVDFDEFIDRITGVDVPSDPTLANREQFGLPGHAFTSHGSCSISDEGAHLLVDVFFLIRS